VSPAPTTYRHAGGFVVRAPLLPFAVLEQLLGGLRAPELAGSAADAAEVEAAIEDDQRTLATRLKALLREDRVVREAIFIASPSLDERITAWIEGDDGDERATMRSVLAYVARMSTRPTPFGLFAGCSTGTIGDSGTVLRLPSHVEARRHTRFDFGFLTGLIRRLEQDSAIQASLVFRPNSGLYRAGRRLRLAEARVERGSVHYRRVVFDEDEALGAVLDAATTGATLSALASVLTGDGVTHEEASEFVAELVAAQLLVSDLGPAITGDEPAPALIERLRHIDAGRETAHRLADAQRVVADVDRRGLGADTSVYRAIGDGLRKLDPDLTLSQLLQVDMVRPAPELAMDETLATELLRAVDLLQRITPAPPPNADLAQFRDDFVMHYEDREVPLLEALDEEVGVGFGPRADAARRQPRPDGGAADVHRLRLLTRALSTAATELELTDDDVRALTNDSPLDVPDAASLACVLAAPSGEAAARGDVTILLQGVFGPSGARMLGRFCHADPALERLVRRHVEDEEACRPDAVFAEVVHLAEGRLGNVLARPVLRAHEIELHGTSGAPDGAKLALDDLVVAVHGERVVLRSRRLGREVVPRLTSAHNFYSSELAAYRFLGVLQQQGVASTLAWSWGQLAQAPFLPRVRHGRLVLTRAQWLFAQRDLLAVVEAKTLADRFRAVQALRERHRVPRWVAVAVGDNELTLDLATAAGCDSFTHEARRLGGIRAIELFPAADELCMETPDGALFHELHVPLTKRAVPPAMTAARRASRHADDEVFPPGSEWLTAKLYTGRATADAIARDVIGPLVDQLTSAGLVDRWFFLRYSDPDWHLRVRFHGPGADSIGQVLPLLRAAVQPLLVDGTVWRFHLDTYRRETHRYGGPAGVALSEQLFAADSDAVVAVLRALPSEDDADLRWRIGLAGVDRLLADFGLSTPDRHAAVRRWRDELASEHGRQGKTARQHAGQVFRRERASLTALLDGTLAAGPMAGATAALDARSARLAPVAAGLRRLADAGDLSCDVLDVVSSYSHMHVNRLLRANQRLQELMIYDLLDRLYNGRIHRGGQA
jgi:thiopeptide-type bacteriocin biosynthesis protein